MTEKVLIIGAGPAGACLAQILRNKNIPYEIFEREADLHTSKGGTFMLDSALPYMSELLPDDMGDWWTNSVNYPEYDFILQSKGAKGNASVVGWQLGGEAGERPSAIAVNRKKIRSWMVQHLPVQAGKSFTHYEEDKSGVTAFFSDGSSTRGSMLVGADGAGSPVRKQLLENPASELHTFVPICGDFIMSGKTLECFHKLTNYSFVAVLPEAQVAVSLLESGSDQDRARCWWLAAFRSDDPQADTAWIRSATTDELFQKALNAASGAPELVIDALEEAGSNSVWSHQIRFSEFLPPQNLPDGRVTLLGDAAHNTTPYGGMGANTGIRDACDLGRLLGDHDWTEKAELLKLLRRYESIMIPRGRRVVLSSRAIGLDENFGMNGDNPDIIPWGKTIVTCDPIPYDKFEADPASYVLARTKKGEEGPL